MANSSVDISELNSEEIERIAPLILFLVVVVLVGIPGNLCVCLVFWRSYKGSNSKFFILLLACTDCISCLVVMLEIFNVLHQYTFTLDWLCKLTIFLEVWPVVTSGVLLCIISIDRYRKVCHPFEWQVTNKAARISCVVIVCLALMYAWPALVLFGVKSVATHHPNITGTDCGILPEYQDNLIASVYNGCLWVTFMISLFLLTILYSLITKKLFIQSKRTQNNVNVIRCQTEREDTMESETTSSAFAHREKSFEKAESKVKRSSTVSSGNIVISGSTIKRSIAAKARTVKSAYVMGIISIVFIFSFLPYLILRLLEVLDKTFYENLSDTERAVYKTVLRCYFLNSAINPIIYCVCSTYFRQDLKQKLQSLWHKWRITT